MYAFAFAALYLNAKGCDFGHETSALTPKLGRILN
jgi:hypothetical protein